MKYILYLGLLLLATNCSGQISTKIAKGVTIRKNESLQADTTIKVEYRGARDKNLKTDFYLNNELKNQSLLSTIDPALIDTIFIKDGNIHVNTKSAYSPKIISLKDLKAKYTNLGDTAVLFTINDMLINEEYDKYVVDENFVYKIVVEKFKSSKNNCELRLVNLKTRTDKNMQMIVR